jgi:hypothetical protein
VEALAHFRRRLRSRLAPPRPAGARLVPPPARCLVAGGRSGTTRQLLGFLRNLFAGASGKQQAELERRIERIRDEFAETLAWLRKRHHGYPTPELRQAQTTLLARLDHVPEELRETMRTVEVLATRDWPTLTLVRIEELERSGRAEIAVAAARLTKPLSP